jgi:phenylalanyl-tRNA synthetase beta chain
MKLPLSWIKEYITLDLQPEEIADILTMAGLEVDHIEKVEKEVIFDISLTPNLNHCSSAIGVARELSIFTGKEIHIPSVEIIEESAPSKIQQASISILDSEKCPLYSCRIIEGVTVKESPDWLKKRLSECGIRPVNNIVDITNFVLWEMGHPLHAFDYDCIEGGKISVKNADQGERFITLDGKEHILSNDMLLIRDGSRAIALAGIMGGANSEVSEKTHNLLLESAYFQPASIRRTSKKLAIQTDASKRFERGSDPNGAIPALERATLLIQQLAGGKVILEKKVFAQSEFPEKAIPCRLSRINKVLGTNLSLSEVENSLKRLKFHYRWDRADTFTILAPTYRTDLSAEIDLIEEVGRIYGYLNIDRKPPIYHTSQLPSSDIFLFEREIRSRLIGEGLQEFLTCDLISPSALEVVQDKAIPQASIIHVLNPTSIDQSVLRPSLMPGLLQLVKYNLDRQNHSISGFEIGHIHFKNGEDNYKEQSVVGIILSGKAAPHSWDAKPTEVDFFDLKGIVENILDSLKIQNYHLRVTQLNTFHSGRQSSIFVDSLEIGSIGEIHPAVQRRLDCNQRILFAELNLHNLFKVRGTMKKMEPLPIYPNSERDWTVTLDEGMAIQELLDQIGKAASPLLEEVYLLDIYRSDKLGKDKKNATLRFIYRDKEKTISQAEVDTEHAKILNSSNIGKP